MGRKQITFYRSYYNAIWTLRSKSDRYAILEAVLAYGFDEVEPDPEKLKPQMLSLFELIRPTLDTARRKAADAMKRQQCEETESKP